MPLNGVYYYTQQTNQLGSINPSTGVSVGIPLPYTLNYSDLYAAANGSLWIALSALSQPAILQFNPTTGASTTYTAGIEVAGSPVKITAAPDGTIWFSTANGKLGQLNPTTGTISLHVVEAPSVQLYGLIVTPDGSIWYTGERFVNNIGINGFIGHFQPTAGSVTEYPIADAAGDLVYGPDHNVWFTENNGTINRVTTGY